MKADILREKFLNFFKARKHKIMESDSLVPKDDPTVLFTPAGMNQFKKQFLGYVTDFTRAATAQRCLRTDDLDKVGKTPAHHTFFEMLGNFSFGDYFKKEAIAYAWEFLTEELKIKKEKLWASVYKDDAESYRIWKDDIKIKPARIIKLGDKENFWPSQVKEKGPNGPCGPCSEIFFDLGNSVGCGKPDCDPGCGCGRFIEIWNLVFTQFNRKPDKTLEPLPKKNIDTGMGLERLAAVMQGVKNNFETDLFKPLVKEINAHAVRSPNQPNFSYAIADHIRAIVFSIYDGVLPSNEGRGYVVRKIVRKATLHLRNYGIKKPFLYKLVPIVSEIMKAPYPQLGKRTENIAQIILAEEESFINTLNSSQRLFEEIGFAVSDPASNAHKAFQLYDTYGIPYELTKSWLAQKEMQINEEVFQKDLSQQKMRSKLQSTMKGDVFGFKDLALGIPETKFSGYKEYSVKAKIIRILKDNVQVKKAAAGDEVEIILDKTPFYPESGGQAGDTGELTKGKNIFEVLDTQKSGKVIIHTAKVKTGSFKTRDFVLSKINAERRLFIARNHTATHLLQAALRKILGAHVQQQGSLVDAQKLRFDFMHFKSVNKGELDRIEETVNGYIINNYPVDKKEVSLAQAKKEGALAFFAEKYENKVRLVSIGDFSKELCGGTHLDFTGQIGIFKLLQEESVASGVRRIEAITGTTAYKMMKKDEHTLYEVAAVLNADKENLAQEIQAKLAKIKSLEKQVNLQKIDTIQASIDTLIQNAYKIDNMKIITKAMDDLDMELLRKTVDAIKQKTDNSLIVLGSANQGRALLVMGITQDLCQKGLDASKLIIDVAKLIGGSGGGRKDFAQAGGNRPENLQAAFDKLIELVKP